MNPRYYIENRVNNCNLILLCHELIRISFDVKNINTTCTFIPNVSLSSENKMTIAVVVDNNVYLQANRLM